MDLLTYLKIIGCTLMVLLFSESCRSQTNCCPEDMVLGEITEGQASYYGLRFHGKTTASGESMDKYALTCAHRTLPFGTMLEITNLDNGKYVTVRVNDRGPYSRNRLIDLSHAAAEEIGLIHKGVGKVSVMVVGCCEEVYLKRYIPEEQADSVAEPPKINEGQK